MYAHLRRGGSGCDDAGGAGGEVIDPISFLFGFVVGIELALVAVLMVVVNEKT